MTTIFATTSSGIEDLAAKEIQEILGKKVYIDGPGRITFNVNKLEEAVRVLYLARLVKRVMLKLAAVSLDGTQNDLKKMYDAVNSSDLSSFLTSKDSFAVRSKRVGKHEYTSIDVSRVTGQAVIDRIIKEKGYRQKVDLDKPDVIFRSYVLYDCFYFALDLTGDTSLERRGYRTEVHLHPASLSPILAACMLRLTGWNGTQVLLDPMCGLGTICIEAACMARKIPAAYLRKSSLQVVKRPPSPSLNLEHVFNELDTKIEWHRKPFIIGSDIKEKYIRGARKHAEKIIVHDTINFNVKKLEDYIIDQQGSIDLIVSNPPYGLRVGHPKKVEAVYHTLFKVAHHLLTDNGKLCIITPHTKLVETLSEKENLPVKHERWVKYGNLNVKIFMCEK
ncbi:MAG: methyltransferase [Candidatus Freyarchaeota archaeon]|nr:methyltransferase [Candidatus Jordarchaeia archaeon]